jgi:hypothetical protein
MLDVSFALLKSMLLSKRDIQLDQINAFAPLKSMAFFFAKEKEKKYGRFPK